MFNPHNLVKTVGFFCLCKIKHLRLLQLFALLPQYHWWKAAAYK